MTGGGAVKQEEQATRERESNRESGLPSMPKGETVGNIVIDGKGGNTQKFSWCRETMGVEELGQ